MSETTKTYIAKEALRHSGTVYHPGDKILSTNMDAETAMHHIKHGRLEMEESPDTSTFDVAGPKNGNAQSYTKEQLLKENKTFTENLVREAGHAEEEWKGLHKEPLIDYYLARRPEKSK